ncbi:MAG: hypothetical protein EOR60_10870 [Mesorhizobium sp.]|nr:MAG: hypothetical protein EOR60_10870 [Mesorhizobium sp.]
MRFMRVSPSSGMVGFAARLLFCPALELLGKALSLVEPSFFAPPLSSSAKASSLMGTPLLPGVAPLQIFETRVSY